MLLCVSFEASVFHMTQNTPYASSTRVKASEIKHTDRMTMNFTPVFYPSARILAVLREVFQNISINFSEKRNARHILNYGVRIYQACLRIENEPILSAVKLSQSSQMGKRTTVLQ